MSVLQQLTTRLAALESRLADRPEVAGELRVIRAHLESEKSLWIGAGEARRLLGVKSVATIKAWTLLGLLRSRQAPNGRLQVHLEDVLRQRQAREDLSAMGSVDTPLADEARAALRQPLAPEVQAVVDAILARVEERLPTREQVNVG